MPAEDPIVTEIPAPAALPAAPRGPTGAMRAGALVAFTFIMPAVALVGPNEICQMLFPTPGEPQAPQVARHEATPGAELALHGDLNSPPRTAPDLAAAATPRFGSPPDAPPPAAAPVQLAHHFDATPAATYSFREPAENSQDGMQEIQQRLQLLGAQYMVLETWGDVAPRYRFCCRIPDRWGNVRSHEAISSDPLAAMQLVLGEVEQRLRGS